MLIQRKVVNIILSTAVTQVLNKSTADCECVFMVARTYGQWCVRTSVAVVYTKLQRRVRAARVLCQLAFLSFVFHSAAVPIISGRSLCPYPFHTPIITQPNTHTRYTYLHVLNTGMLKN